MDQIHAIVSLAIVVPLAKILTALTIQIVVEFHKETAPAQINAPVSMDFVDLIVLLLLQIVQARTIAPPMGVVLLITHVNAIQDTQQQIVVNSIVEH